LKARAAAMAGNDGVSKNSVLDGVDYVALYNKCVKFLMDFLVLRNSRNTLKRLTPRKDDKTLRRSKGVKHK